MMHDAESQCGAMSHVTLNCIMKQLNTGCLQQGATYCILYKILKTERLFVKRYDYLHFKLEVVAAEVDVATTNSYSINTIGRLVVVGLVVL